MMDPFASHREELASYPPQKVQGTIAGLFKAEGSDFQTKAVSELQLTFEGIPGDVHAGFTRKSGGREPWYDRGTEMRNERQLSILSSEELRGIARRMDIPELKSEWIGGNLQVEGIANLTRLPPRTVLFFEGGVTIRIDGDNLPCRVAGRAIAAQFDGREELEMAFPKQSDGMRGLVAWVEKEGVIKVGEKFEARIPAQWIYKV